MAALLLAGTVLAALPALAQQRTALQPDLLVEETAADPFAPAGAAENGPSGLPAEADAIEATDDSAGRIAREGVPTNLRESPLDGLRGSAGIDRDAAPGIRLGAFVLKPSLSQGIYGERRSGGGSTSRSYSQTGFRGSLTSDWSRHQLTIDADGIYQRNISGTGETEPSLRIGADLRLDLAEDTIANLTAGYDFEREDASDPNAVTGASTQAAVHGFTGGARVTRDFGQIRGTVGATLRRETYGSARLSDGSNLSLSDRNNNEGTLTARLGYEISPALIPYLEASAGRTLYDDKRDALGYERSFVTLGGRGGVEIDLGDKLRGDLGVGYKRASFDDRRLSGIDAATVDGSVTWSPQRGTDLRLSLATTIEPSTAAGQGGYVAYESDAELTHELRDNLVARLTGGYTWRDMPASIGADQSVYEVGAGLTWDINRWLALTGDVSYELTRQAGGPDTGVTRAGIGLVLRR